MGKQLQLMVGNLSGTVSIQIEITMVCQVKNRICIAYHIIGNAQSVLLRQLIQNRKVPVSAKAKFPIFHRHRE